MNDIQTDRARLSEAIGRVVDRFAKKQPTMSVLDVCAALSVVAGTVAAVNIPAGNPDADLLVCNTVGLSLGEAMKAARRLKAS